jgi:hypothetical protein
MLWKAAGAVLVAACALQANAQSLTADTRQVHNWVVKARDHHGKPFAIVDKKAARIAVFDADGRMRGSSTILLGQAPGDDIAPNVGEHAQLGEVPFRERTTPAGRFAADAGVNNEGEQVIWVDYQSAFAIHRLRPNHAEAARKIRFASPKPQDHRVSYGCVVVPVAFYKDVVQPWLGNGRSIVYVLPERGTLQDMFSAL